MPKGRFPTAIRVLPFAAAVVGCVSLALVTGDPAAAFMRAVVASDCSPNGSTGQVVAMISCPLALKQHTKLGSLHRPAQRPQLLSGETIEHLPAA